MTTGHLAADLGILAVLLAAAAALVVLAVGSREVFSSPLTYLGQSS
jgi:TRAP-type C4-dicarboxylate transport system permease small subunit